jgi:hypothetical protein
MTKMKDAARSARGGVDAKQQLHGPKDSYRRNIAVKECALNAINRCIVVLEGDESRGG